MDYQPSIIALFLFYLLIIENYIQELIPCGLQRLLSCSIVAKHVIGYLALTFSVILTSDSGITNSFGDILYQSTMLYLLFIISSRLSQKMSVLFLVICCIIYILFLFKKTSNFNNLNHLHQRYFKNTILIFTIILYLVAGTGFIYYYIKKRKEYKKRFNNLHFIFGRLKCRKTLNCDKKQPK